ncbi:dihydroxyacetone kinase subunit L [Mediterraneibacter butyricigenes]|uniref:phosphoenolpyruvate--glycerone phosphotransferase n=1 Tax=Mediterraneibacter butyricigenes TaxID=2316025 RepID=A0A391P1S4_9FIRM|nr:dihydroxyacetone kinase subunit DhaL [Mediterraneibacter butyricigenes]RGO27856.1 dihydroxyacetone kinase subunit L [Dorea sp. OM02-2LB]RGV95392.1 dihydroxyacetone kinase subunit L [Ruminococcus sp. AF14-10]GCA65906.1 dihydroxyacetone kinase subunit L [Mediterraneibacter butyricigenes]
MADSKKVIQILQEIAHKIEAEKDFLTKLDQPIGDSDHGINMARGFGEVEKKLPTLEGKDIGTILKTVGMTLVSTVGGASGPLYGSAFLKAGIACAGKEELDLSEFLSVLETATEAVKQRGKSTTEEKTMLDAMVPSLEAMHTKLEEGGDAKAVLSAGVDAAWKGVEHTKDLVATKGRASYVGERGIGHQDPGATSYSDMLEVIRDQI